MMEATGLDSAPTSIYIASIAVIAICVVFFFAFQGLVLNWSLSLVAFTPVGYLYACFVVFAMTSVGSVMVTLIGAALPDAGQEVLICYSIAAGALTLMLLVQCSPFQAALAYLCFLLLSVMSALAISVILFALLLFASPWIGGPGGQAEGGSSGTGLNAVLGRTWCSSKCPQRNRPEPTPVKYAPSESGTSVIQANPF